MRKFSLSLIAAFSLCAPLFVSGCEMGSEEKTEEHHHDDHQEDHDGQDK